MCFRAKPDRARQDAILLAVVVGPRGAVLQWDHCGQLGINFRVFIRPLTHHEQGYVNVKPKRSDPNPLVYQNRFSFRVKL